MPLYKSVAGGALFSSTLFCLRYKDVQRLISITSYFDLFGGIYQNNTVNNFCGIQVWLSIIDRLNNGVGIIGT